MTPRVGFLGLGAMGLPMARRVIQAGFPLFTAPHHRRQPADELAALGATVCSGTEQVAAQSSIVITILPADLELEQVGSALIAALTPGKIWIDMTTAAASTLLRLEPSVRAAGCRLLDAPVSGGVSGAGNGTLTIMAGGDPDLLDECRPLLAAMGNRIVHTGPLGQGKVVKMVNQLLAATHLAALAEAFTLGIRCGASPEVLYDVIRTSSGFSKVMDLRLPGYLLTDSFEPGFRLALMHKDVGIALDSARAAGVPVPLADHVDELFQACRAAGQGDRDYSYAARHLAALSGVSISTGAAVPAQ